METMAVFVHALRSVVSEVRLSDTMGSRNAASSNAPHVDGEEDAAATSVNDTAEANGANEAQAAASEPQHTNATNAQQQGANAGSGRWLSFFQNLRAADSEQEQLRNTCSSRGGSAETHYPQPVEVEMAHTG